jgi:predicted phage tail protein
MPDDFILSNTFVNLNDILLPVMDASLIPGQPIDIAESPTYQWNGATMLARIGEVLPIVYGRHVVAPTLINAFIEEGEYETLNMLLAWCEGEIESITNIKVGGTQIENLYNDAAPNNSYADGAEISVRTGQVNQEPIQHFDELHNFANVSTMLYKNQPYTFEGTIEDAQAFRLEFNLDKLYQKDLQGNDLSWYVAVQVELKKAGDAEFKTLGIIEINKKSTTNFDRYFKTEYLERGRYILRVTKVSDNAQVGANALTYGNIELITIDEIRSENLEYPTAALTGIRLVSFQDLNGAVPNITGVVTGKKVRMPKVTFDVEGTQPVDWEQYYYDPTLPGYRRLGTNGVLYWDGATYHDQWGGNPVWCLRDLLLSKRYGLGDFVEESMVDELSFVACAQYCEEAVLNDEGEKEKRCILDVVFDVGSPAPDVIATIVRTFRGILFQSEGILRLIIEKSEQPKALFNMGNIIASTFSMQYLAKKSPNVLSIQFTNRDKSYLRDSFEIGTSEQQLADTPADVQTFALVGLTRLTQVLRDGRVYLNKLQNTSRVISFSAFYDSVLLQPFDVIEFQHDVPGWGSGGRVTEFNTDNIVTLDTDVFVEPGKTYKLKIRNPNTDEIEERDVADIPGVYRTLNVSVPFSFIPKENDLWTLAANDASGSQTYRITNIQKSEQGRITITAIENNNEVYDPTAIVIPQEIYTHLTLEIPKVNNLTLQELTNKLPNGTFESRIQVSWKLPSKSAKYVKQATSYEIWLSDNSGASWQLIGRTEREYYVIPDSVSTNVLYQVAVVSIAENGEKNPLATSPLQEIVIQGAVIPPAQVQNVQHTFTDEIILTWDKNPENDIQAYEIRTSDVGWGSNESADFVWRGQANRFVVVRPTQREGIIYYIRAINTSGVLSSISATIEPTNPRPSSPLLLSTALFEKVFLTWLPLGDLDLDYYEIWQNSEPVFFGVDGQEGERLISREAGTTFVATIPFATTYYRICGVDRFGRGTFSNIIRADQVQIGSGGIAPDAIIASKISDNAIETQHLSAGVVTAGKIAARAVIADNIDVGQLSAISADLGTIRSGQIIGATIKTSDDIFRLEMDSLGLRAYDRFGRQTVDLAQGILRMFDPARQDYYSFLDSGGLVLHTPYEDVPYATRIKAGVATAGDHVTLPLWRSKPELQLSVKRLRSYDASFSESNQEWCLYADNLSFYDFGGANFGWGFDVRAKLVKSGGARNEIHFDVPFNNIQCTGLGVCQIQVGMCFQIWCNQLSPDPICAGHLCYRINYRKVGDSLFCSRDFEYTQPYDTVALIKNTNKVCHTIDFGMMGQWEIFASELGRNYIASPYTSGGYVSVPVPTYTDIDKSFFASKICYAHFSGEAKQLYVGSNKYGSAHSDVYAQFASFDQVCAVVCSSAIAYNASTIAAARRDFYNTQAEARITGVYGGLTGLVGKYPSSNGWYCCSSIVGGTSFASFQQRLLLVKLDAYLAQNGTWNTYEYASACVYGDAVQTICFKCCCVEHIVNIQNVLHFLGNPDARDVRLFSSMLDVVGSEVVLDPSGEINYLAIAYR